MKPRWKRFTVFLIGAWGLSLGCSLEAQALSPAHIDDFTGRPRVIVISDIGNEPDDQMSFVRLLLYSNEFDIEGLIAATSTWQRTATHPETMHALIQAYRQVRPNLLLHATGWPTAEDLDRLVFTGQPGYGMAAIGPDKLSPGAESILRAGEREDSRPLWICIWGGADTLAEALLHLKMTRTPDATERFVQKLRVYSISDQDDAGLWIRREFPSLFYIVQPSTQAGDEYYYATWTGISGDVFYRNCAGADFSTVTNKWLDKNIRNKGPLGKLYPRYAFIMEGDTPSFLGLIDNGLNSYRRPDWGGWGGRYVYRRPYGEPHSIWTQGGDESARMTSQDSVTGVDGKEYTSDQATIWRWREAFQNDFAARMSWTISDFARANHNPEVEVNGNTGTAPILVEAEVGQPLLFDASRSRDPDGQNLHYRWFQYNEAGASDANHAQIAIAGGDGPTVTVTPIAACRSVWLPRVEPCVGNGTAHLILAVSDDGSPQLTSYRRILLNVHAPAAYPDNH